MNDRLARINNRPGQRRWIEVTPEDFVAVRDNCARREFLSYQAEEFGGFLCVLSEDGYLGFSVGSDGEISNVFNVGRRGIGGEAVNAAIECGGYHLNCFDGFLPDYYKQFGFEETGRVKFDRNLAPAEWSYAKYGQPDVVYMTLKPEVKRQFDPK